MHSSNAASPSSTQRVHNRYYDERMQSFFTSFQREGSATREPTQAPRTDEEQLEHETQLLNEQMVEL